MAGLTVKMLEKELIDLFESPRINCKANSLKLAIAADCTAPYTYIPTEIKYLRIASTQPKCSVVNYVLLKIILSIIQELLV